MINNPYIIEKLIDDKLTNLRAEGMRSQMLAEARMVDHKEDTYFGLSRIFQQVAKFVKPLSPRRLVRPGARKIMAH